MSRSLENALLGSPSPRCQGYGSDVTLSGRKQWQTSTLCVACSTMLAVVAFALLPSIHHRAESWAFSTQHSMHLTRPTPTQITAHITNPSVAAHLRGALSSSRLPSTVEMDIAEGQGQNAFIGSIQKLAVPLVAGFGLLLYLNHFLRPARQSQPDNYPVWHMSGVSGGPVEGAATSDNKAGGIWDLEAFSPSKINLFLRIIRRRPDGYHDLASLFQAINLGDHLSFKLLPEGASDDIFECNMPGVPLDRSNLVLRAIDLLRAKTGVTQRMHVRLDKTVPAQAGLGGGSGNAATALWAANELFGRPATLAQLVEWSADLGSDITFFLSEGTAYCTGRGEILTPLPPLPPQRIYVFKPDIGLSTAAVFKALDLSALSPADPNDLLRMFQAAHPNVAAAPAEAFVNDLESPAFSIVPELGQLRDELRGYGFPHVFMSGSGTSIIALGEPTGPLSGQQVVDKLNGRDGLKAFQADFMWRRGNDPEGNPQWY